MELPFKVLQHGELMNPSLYTWEESTKIFSTAESHLVVIAEDGFTFITGNFCFFITGSYNVFKTGFSCTFNTLHNCSFQTLESCTFDTGSKCVFDVGEECVLIRRDRFEVHTLIPEVRMILPSDGVPGWSNADTFESQLFDKNL